MPSKKDLILIFLLNNHKFAIEVKDLVEVIEGLKVSSASMVEGCLGEVKFREKTIPLLDIRKMLEFTGGGRKYSAVIVVRVGGITVAIPVDSVAGVAEIKGDLLPFPKLMLKECGVYSFIYDRDGEFVLGLNLAGFFKGEFLSRLKAAIEERG